MSAVQRTMHREYRGGSGHRPEAPWAFDRLPRRRRLRAYLIAVTATEFILAGWQLTRFQPQADQLVLFAIVLGCGEETQTVLRLDEAVALIGEQQILVHDSGIFERSDRSEERRVGKECRY